MKLDYKDTRAYRPTRKESRRLRWRWHTALLIVSSVISFFILFEPGNTHASTRLTHLQTMSYSLALPNDTFTSVPESLSIQANDEVGTWHTVIVKPGDSLANIAYKQGVHASEVLSLMRNNARAKELIKLFPGDEVRIKKSEDGQLLALSYELNDMERLEVSKESNQFIVNTVKHHYDTHQNRISAVIKSSLYDTAKAAGLTDNVIMELANIFSYDIDFALDVRQEDQFTVIWEEYYREGEKLRDGPIIAAEFVNSGRVVRAIRFTDDSGHTDYFTPDGRSLRKAFLRSPVHFSHISSRFNLNRLHPIFNTKRPHRGVDYAAASGTPVYAAGDGKVIFRGKKNGYGNVVIVKHGERYNTLYAHLSKFQRKVGLGTKVKQGQTIGYVGQTGWATGPHLHYEFRVNGVHRNPLTVKLPSAEPLPKKYLSQFKIFSGPLLAQLTALNRTQLALNP